MNRAILFGICEVHELREQIFPFFRELKENAKQTHLGGNTSFIAPLEMKRGLSLDDLTVYSSIDDELVPSSEITSFDGYSVLIITIAPFRGLMIDLVDSYGGKNELTMADIGLIDRWPRYVNETFIKRRLGIVTAQDLPSRLDFYANGNEKLFAKTLVKTKATYGTIVTSAELLAATQDGLPAINQINEREFTTIRDDTDLLLSETLDIVQDELGTQEYRAWIIDNQVSAIMRHRHPNVTNVPASTYEFAEKFTAYHKGTLPRHYVLDIGQFEKVGEAVVELNCIIASGNTNPNIFRKITTAYFK